jgi:septal ring factor EnvC (AmiA/AmiB activator)
MQEQPTPIDHEDALDRIEEILEATEARLRRIAAKTEALKKMLARQSERLEKLNTALGAPTGKAA